MKVVNIETFKVSIPLSKPAMFATRIVRERDYTVVRVDTDEGIEGYGICWWHHPALIIEKYLRNHIIGSDPLKYEELWDRMYYELYRERKGGAICAISAVDIAIWDIICKYYNKPLYKLLGNYRDKVPCYASGGYYREKKGVDGLVREIMKYVKMGFKAAKIKIGRLSINEDYERVKAVRDEVGEDFMLMIDANNAYNRYEAIKAGKMFETLKVYWFEEPLWPDDIEGMAYVRQKISIPIAAGELEYTRYGFKELITRGAVDIIQPDVTFCGGITEFLKIAHLAESHGIPVAPHAAHDIHAQLVAAIPNGLIVEYFLKEADIMKDMVLYKKTLQPKNGYLQPSDRPGVGIIIDEEKLQEFQIK